MKHGDRVRDKFKVPKPGDDCVTGRVLGDPDSRGIVVVEWDDGRKAEVPVVLLEMIEPP